MSEVKLTIIDPRVDLTICDDNVAVHITDSGPQGPQGPRGSTLLSGSTDPSPVVGLVGDQYINTTTGYIFGPKTESGWGTGVLLGVGIGISDVSYVHYQTVPSNSWTILESEHGLQFSPSVTVVDTSGNVLEADCQYVDGDIVITFTSPLNDLVTGAAYLS